MITYFTTGYEFDVGEFLSRELQDREVGHQNTLLAYLYMITQIYLASRVLELTCIDEMIKAGSTFNIELIRDAANPLAQPMR